MKKISIILLNWHGWKDTLACIDSLKVVDYPNFEIIVVDNASADDSVARISGAHPDLKIIVNKDNLGFGGGCNVGIRQALSLGAEFVWLLNNDTLVEKKTLSSLVEKISQDSQLGAVGSVLYYMDQPSRVQAWGGGKINHLTGTARHFYSSVVCDQLEYLTAASILIRKEPLESCGLFDEKFFMYWEDVDFSFRLRKAGWKICVAEDSHLLHKESASLGKRNPKLSFYFNESAIRFFRKHGAHPFFSIIVGVFGRSMKALMRRDFSSFIAIIRAVVFAASGRTIVRQ